MIYYLLLSFIKYQTKCRHSLHELTGIIGELLLDNIHLIDIIGVTLISHIKGQTKRAATLAVLVNFNRTVLGAIIIS
jgi:hypothetical protein